MLLNYSMFLMLIRKTQTFCFFNEKEGRYFAFFSVSSPFVAWNNV